MQVVRDTLVGPLTEEFAFRACMAPLLVLQVGLPSPPAVAGSQQLLLPRSPLNSLPLAASGAQQVHVPRLAGILPQRHGAGDAALLWRGAPPPLVRLCGPSGLQHRQCPVRGESLRTGAGVIGHPASKQEYGSLPNSPLKGLLPALQVAFQFGFTTIFGWYATFVFLRTGHLAAPIAAHAFCNWMGFPRFGDVPAHPAAMLLKAAFATGILLFVCMLRPLTDPGLYGNAAAGTQENLYVSSLRAL